MKKLQSNKTVAWVIWAIATAIFAILVIALSGTALVVAAQIWVAITALSVVRAYLYDICLWSLNQTFALNPTYSKGYLYKVWVKLFGSDTKELSPFTRVKFQFIAGTVATLIALLYLGSRATTENTLLLIYANVTNIIKNLFSIKTFIWFFVTAAIWFSVILLLKAWFRAGIPLPHAKEEGWHKWSFVIIVGLIIVRWLVNLLYFQYNARLAWFTFWTMIPLVLITFLFSLWYSLVETGTKKRLDVSFTGDDPEDEYSDFNPGATNPGATESD